MSFSAVAAPALMAVRQTNTFRDNLERELWALVTLDTIPVQVRGPDGLLAGVHRHKSLEQVHGLF